MTIGTTARFEGVVLGKTMIAVNMGASVNGRLLAQTAVTLQMNAITEAYLDRWQIEVLHRDLKSGIGMGQCQVRKKHAVDRIHSGLAAAYAFLLIATLMTQGQQRSVGSSEPPIPSFYISPPLPAREIERRFS